MKFGAGLFQNWERYQRASRVHRGESTWSLGLPQWAEKEWKGSLYPTELGESDFLSFYGQHFSCVEVSSTFYAPVSRERLAEWASKVPDHFRFLPKWPELITHRALLKGLEQELKAFLDSLAGLEHKLGTTIVQLPPQFSRQFHRELYYFLLKVPRDLPLCLEFRHGSWFDQGELNSRLYDYLQKEGIGMVCSDLPARSDLFHRSFPGKRNLVRYVSDQHRENDRERLSNWRNWQREFLPAEEFYFVLHQEDNSTIDQLIPLIDQDVMNSLEQARSPRQQSLPLI